MVIALEPRNQRPTNRRLSKGIPSGVQGQSPPSGSSGDFEVDRGPDWLFVKLPTIDSSGDLQHGEEHSSEQPSFPVEYLADQLWALLRKHFVYRLTVEMEEIHFLSSSMMGQLVKLQKRVLQHGGAMRLCGLSPQCQQALHLCRLDRIMPNFPNREAAVLGQLADSRPR